MCHPNCVEYPRAHCVASVQACSVRRSFSLHEDTSTGIELQLGFRTHSKSETIWYALVVDNCWRRLQLTAITFGFLLVQYLAGKATRTATGGDDLAHLTTAERFPSDNRIIIVAFLGLLR